MAQQKKGKVKKVKEVNASESIKGFVYLHKFFLLKNNQESEYFKQWGDNNLYCAEQIEGEKCGCELPSQESRWVWMVTRPVVLTVDMETVEGFKTRVGSKIKKTQ